jgi:hypothetical protein
VCVCVRERERERESIDLDHHGDDYYGHQHPRQEVVELIVALP